MFWDLYRDGITQSMLCKWVVCPHRFWLYAVKGLVEDDGSFPYKLHYGNCFHVGLDTYATGRHPPEVATAAIKNEFFKLRGLYPSDVRTIGHWSRVCQAQFRAYVACWATEDAQYDSLEEEAVFAHPYTLPSGRVVTLKGKRDAVLLHRFSDANYLKEHKVKGEVDEEGLMATIDQNLQTMFYMVPLSQTDYGFERPRGVLYNVIRRPLSFGKHNIKKLKGNKKTPAETDDQYYARLEGLMHKYPDDFFHRWKVAITDDDILRFRQESLDPLLEQLCDWWESIQNNPDDPWHTLKRTTEWETLDEGVVINKVRETEVRNHLHYRRPFGIYDALANGMHGDYWEFLTTGKQQNLRKIKTVFPELLDDSRKP